MVVATMSIKFGALRCAVFRSVCLALETNLTESFKLIFHLWVATNLLIQCLCDYKVTYITNTLYKVMAL